MPDPYCRLISLQPCDDFVGQVGNLWRIVNPPLVGQPIVAAAGFQPALFVSRFVGFCRKRRSRLGSSVPRVNEFSSARTMHPAKWDSLCFRSPVKHAA
jgi:hypothetical protein